MLMKLITILLKYYVRDEQIWEMRKWESEKLYFRRRLLAFCYKPCVSAHYRPIWLAPFQRLVVSFDDLTFENLKNLIFVWLVAFHDKPCITVTWMTMREVACPPKRRDWQTTFVVLLMIWRLKRQTLSTPSADCAAGGSWRIRHRVEGFLSKMDIIFGVFLWWI